MIKELVATLEQHDLYLESEEVADVVWLAAQIAARAPAAPSGTAAPRTVGPAGERPQTTPDSKSVPSSEEPPGERGGDVGSGAAPLPAALKQQPPELPSHRTDTASPGDGERHIALYRRSAGTERAEEAGAALALRVAGATSIPAPRELARALRPLMIRIPSSVRFAIDEEATVHRYAETRLLLPVMVPLPERWLDLVLVVDGARSMRIWEQTVRELKPLLERQGAFRNSQLWTLDSEAETPVLYRGPRRPQAHVHGVHELVDPASDRFIVVISDCVAPAWDDGRMGHILREWSRNELVILLQVLPERLWQRTGLGSASPVYLSQPHRCGNNNSMRARPAAPSWFSAPTAGTSVPVTRLDAPSLSRVAALVAARPGAQCVGYSFPTLTPAAAAVPPPADNAEESPSPLARLRRFQANASRPAQKLAHYLAAIPLSLPTMRLVRETMLPEADDGHLAEVLLGALLYEQDGKELHDESEPQSSIAINYEFYDGVRDLLLEGSPVSDTVRVLDRVSEYLAHHHGSTLDFRATLPDPSALPREIPEAERPFAKLQASVLRRLGGAYTRLADRLERTQPAPEAEAPDLEGAITEEADQVVEAKTESRETAQGLRQHSPGKNTARIEAQTHEDTRDTTPNIQHGSASGFFQLEVLAARSGESLLLHFNTADAPHLCLIDGGGPGVYRQTLKPRLQEIGHQWIAEDEPLSLDLAILTHMHDPQARGMLDLLQDMERMQSEHLPPFLQIRDFWFNALTNQLYGDRKGASESEIRRVRQLLDLLERLQIPRNGTFNGGPAIPDATSFEAVKLPGEAQVQILAPSGKSLARLESSPSSDPNLISLALLFEADGQRLLLPSDQTGDNLLRALDQASLLDEKGLHLDLLKLPHHGSSRDLSPEFFRLLTADHYLITGDGRHGMPHIETLEMLMAARGDAPFSLYFCPHPRSYRKEYPVDELLKFLEDQTTRNRGFRYVFAEPNAPSLMLDFTGGPASA